MSRTVVVTGGAGFIGSELVRELVAEGARVVVVDTLVNGRRENLETLPADRARLEVADVREAERMRPLLAGVDVVFHLACLGVRHPRAADGGTRGRRPALRVRLELGDLWHRPPGPDGRGPPGVP